MALALVSGASLLGMLKSLKWRWHAQAAMWIVLAGITVWYWPKPMCLRAHGENPQNSVSGG